MAERPDNLRQHVRDAVAGGDEYATPYAWVLEDDGTLWYTCRNCTRVFAGHHAFAGHCGSTPGCGVQSAAAAGYRDTVADVLAATRVARAKDRRERTGDREPHALRQVAHQAEPPAPAPARRWWWPW